MSGALERLTAEELAQLKQMKADDDAVEAQEPQQPEPTPSQPVPPIPPTPDQPPAPVEEEPAPGDDRVVDKRAMDRERDRRRQLQTELAEERAKNAAERARLEERLQLIMQATEAAEAARTKAAEPAAEAPPDFNTDPVGAIQWTFKQQAEQTRRMEERLRQIESGTQTLTQAQQQQAQLQDLERWGRAQEAEYAREVGQDDYVKAMEFLKDQRRRELQVGGESDAGRIEQQIIMDLFTTANNARTSGRQFGKVLYELAQVRGWKSAVPADTGNVVPLPNEQVPASVANTATERLLRGRDMARTVGAVGAAAMGSPGVEAIGRMSEEEFAEYHNKVRKQGVAALHNLYGA
jgi:hypothetical protein